MSHRVIAGLAKGKRLKMVPGESTRPIMDRAKEALFSILGTGLRQSRFLDLFAGTGAVGIEALSRGAEWACFLDINRLAIKTLQENLESTGLKAKAEVLRQDAFEFLQSPPPAKAYSYVYIAPPQYQGLWHRALLALDAQPSLLEPDAWVIVQIDPKEQTQVRLNYLQAHDERTYGNTRLWFFEYTGERESP
jgi:16S rRNA (guanine(966)-N(2))-methyltransferase RsmD